MSRHHPAGKEKTRPRRRHSLWFLPIPILLFLLMPFVANRIHPVILGLPFIIFYTIISVVMSWASVWLASRFDPVYKANSPEPIPADKANRKINNKDSNVR